MNPLEIALGRIGVIVENKQGRKAEIIGISDRRSKSGNVIFIVKFLESGYIIEREYSNLKKGIYEPLPLALNAKKWKFLTIRTKKLSRIEGFSFNTRPRDRKDNFLPK